MWNSKELDQNTEDDLLAAGFGSVRYEGGTRCYFNAISDSNTGSEIDAIWTIDVIFTLSHWS